MFCVEYAMLTCRRTRPFLTRRNSFPISAHQKLPGSGCASTVSFASETLGALELEELCGDMLERVSGSRMSEETARLLGSIAPSNCSTNLSGIP